MFLQRIIDVLLHLQKHQYLSYYYDLLGDLMKKIRHTSWKTL